MSLVNKMLRDLDARRAREIERGSLLTVVSPLPEEATGKGRQIAWALFVVSGLSLAASIQFELGSVHTLVTKLARQANPPPPVAVPRVVEPMATVVTAMPEPAPAAVIPAPTLAAVPEPKPVKKPAPKPVPKPVVAAKPSLSAPQATQATGEGKIDKQMNRPSAQERADAEYRQGVQAQRQGAADEAVVRFRRALVDQPEHTMARQALAGLLIEQRRFDEAEAVLRSGVALGPAGLTFATMLARLKVERGDVPAALAILQQNSAAGERSADFQGFLAVLLNRSGRPGEAANHYRAAAQLAPGEARWWAGLAIALEAEGKTQDAREAYQHARSLPGLPPELAAHIEQRLK